MIGIIDYGMGNLFSVSKALERIGVSYLLSDDINELSSCNGLILPGVGAFPDAMKALKNKELDQFIRNRVKDGIPLLGICLGMQLLFEESEEIDKVKGLGLLPGRVVRFKGYNQKNVRYKVPHMGWNALQIHQPDSPLLAGINDGYVYFVHSYFVDTNDSDILIADASYEVNVPAVVGKDHLFATQFHPEKSGETGMKILKNFCAFVNKGKRREEHESI